MKIGRGVSELWRVENRPLPLTWPMAYTTACTTVQAVILMNSSVNWRHHVNGILTATPAFQANNSVFKCYVLDLLVVTRLII